MTRVNEQAGESKPAERLAHLPRRGMTCHVLRERRSAVPLSTARDSASMRFCCTKKLAPLEAGLYFASEQLAIPIWLFRGVSLVYKWCMARTNIDLDDEACEAVMERFHLDSKREAVNLALRRLASEPLNVDDARRLRGSG